MTLHYQLDGPEGAPVVVLSNSLGTTLSLWEPQLAALTARFRVLRYDTHGHGQTAKKGKVTLSQLAGDVLTLLDSLDIKKAHFCGISMGGLTGLWLARFAPERLLSVTIANSAAKIGEPAGWLDRARSVREEGMATVAAGAAQRWFSEAFRHRSPQLIEPLIDQLARSDAEGYAACCEALAEADLRHEIKAITLPLLVLAGEQDPVTTVADGEFLQQQVAGSQLTIVPASHLSNVEAPQAFNDALIAFLLSQEARHAG